MRSVRINDAFDRVIVLNLDRRPDRWRQVCKALEGAGICAERFAAIDGQEPEILRSYQAYCSQSLAVMPAGAPAISSFTQIAHGQVSREAAIAYLESSGRKAISSAGAWGYLKSMEAILRSAAADGVKSLLVFDDDVVFHQRSAEIFSAAYDALPSDWQVLLLGVMQHHWEPYSILWHSPALYSSRSGAIGSHAVGLRSEVYPLLLEEIERMDLPYDIGSLSTAMRARPNYVIYPNIAIQRIDNNHSDINTSTFLAENSVAFIANKFRWKMSDYFC